MTPLLVAEDQLDGLDDTRHTCRTTDKDDLVGVSRLDAGIRERPFATVRGMLVEVRRQALELEEHGLGVDVLGTRCVGRAT